MRYFIFRLFNGFVGCLPAPLLKRILRAVYLKPELASRAGFQVYPEVFYNPFPNTAEVNAAKLEEKRDLPGIQIDLAKTRGWLGDLARYADETSQFLNQRTGDIEKWNMTYPPADSAVLYATLRHLKPRRFIEVGCGFNSRVSSAALHRNAEDKSPCNALYIEPYPPPYLAELQLPGEFLQS